MKIFHQKDRSAITWASGTSTELYIFPADGDFKTRQFTFRISTATVEAEETTFSDFSGLTRILMPLKGDLTLMHEGRYTKELKPFDQDRFDGSWATRSRGKVQDFNVMFKPHIDAEVIHHAGTAGNHIQLTPTPHHHFLYIHSGEFLINAHPVTEGDFIHIPSNTKIKLTCQTPGHAVEVKVMEG
jgi:environmental stress-induced protein Ves